MKIGEIKQAIQELADENISLRQKLLDSKYMIYRLQMNNFSKALNAHEINFVNSREVAYDNETRELIWVKQKQK